MLFFNKKAVGLDIADRTIEVVEIKRNGKDYEVLGKNKIEVDEGIIDEGIIKNEKKLIKLAGKVLAGAKPHPISKKEIIFGLPESVIFWHIFSLPKNLKTKSSIEERINEEVKKNIPLDKNSYDLDYRIIDSSRGQIVLLAAVEKKVLWQWKSFFEKCNIDVDVFDLETTAVFRGVYGHPPKKPICLIDLGEATTNISIFNKKGLIYSYFINEAGDKFTKDIASKLKIEYDEAEKIKIKNGLKDKNKKAKKVLIDSLNSVINEINISLTFYEEKYKERVNEVVLVGGSSKMEGLVDFLKEHIKKPIKIGQPRILKNKLSLNYLGALGLSLKGVEKRWQNRDPEFITKNIQEIKIKKEIPKIQPEEKSESKSFAPQEEQEIKQALNDLSESNIKIKKQLLLLAVIIVIGVIMISLAFWYRNEERADRNQNMTGNFSTFSQVQILDLKIPVTISEEEATADRAKGRIIENTIIDNQPFAEALSSSKELANASLKEGELLATEPINQVNKDNLVFPLKFTWLALNKKEVDNLFVKELQKINDENTPYILNSITLKDIESTSNPNIYLLNGELKIFTDSAIE